MKDEWGPVSDFHYEAMSGRIFRPCGKEAFTSSDRGYRKARIGNKNFYAHRVAWFLHYGKPPQYEIDHINGDRSDNRISNLRDVPAQINNRNKAKARSSASGITGIYRTGKPACWVPQVSIGNKSKSLGATPCLGIAIQRRRDAEASLGFHQNHGRNAHG